MDLAKFRPPAWTADALCAEVDPELFFPHNGGPTREAKAICARCPVAAECLDYALDHESGTSGSAYPYDSYGIYGGMAPRDRRRLIKLLGADPDAGELINSQEEQESA